MYIKRALNENLTTFKGLHFPYNKASSTFFRHNTVVGIGGNVLDVKRRFHHLFHFLKRDKRVEIIQTSLILKNPPFGYTEQDDFFNSIIVMKTNMQPRVFLNYLLRVEKRFGRKRSFANAPRTLDLDIIFFDNLKMETEHLSVPHPSWSQRESVVIPLASMRK